MLPTAGPSYFRGTIVLVISNQPEPGGKEKIFNYVVNTVVLRSY